MAVRGATTLLEPRDGGAPGEEGFHLLIMATDSVERVSLPDEGEVGLGRDGDAGVDLDDPLASRQHARITIGDELLIEDLNSANGTFVREQRIAAGEPTRLQAGEAIRIGSTILMVMPSPAPVARNRMRTHEVFEARIAEACERARSSGQPLAAVRIQVSSPVTPARVWEVLQRKLRGSDLLAAYGPGEYELLLPGLGPVEAETMVQGLFSALAEAEIDGRFAFACLPEDGRDAATLQARGGERLHTGAGAAPVCAAQAIDSPAMEPVLKLAARVAPSPANVLLLGETGVGKEVLARRIHELSGRAGPFVCVDCGALSEPLLESELFGHERGAFTGAAGAKAGLLETAHGGTVLLDEVGELAPALQAKLLRVLETREVRRLGETRSRTLDVRFLAATNRELEEEVRTGRFRADLFFRLNGVAIVIPPLRERASELPALAARFAQTACERDGRRPVSLAEEALIQLQRYAWPGNVRELRNVIERATLLCDDGVVRPEHLPLERMRLAPALPLAWSDTPSGDERQQILAALTRCAGNQTQAARLLGVSRRTLVSRLDLYGLPRPKKPGPSRQ